MPSHAEPVPTVAPGTEFLGPDADDDELYLVRRVDGRVVRMPWLLYRVATLLDGTRDEAGVADRIGSLDARTCSVEEVRTVVEQRLVPAGIVTVPARPEPAAAEPHERATGGRSRVVPLVLGALVLVAATAAVTTLVVGTTATAGTEEPVAAPGPPAVTAPGDVTGPPTLLGTVVAVEDVATAVVDVEGSPLRVEVAGLAPGAVTPACAVDDALAYAEETLLGEEVALVPDPTLPPLPDDRWRAYMVLDSQLSYTDAAIGAGWGTAGEGRYSAGFQAGQETAEADGVGMFGPPCQAG